MVTLNTYLLVGGRVVVFEWRVRRVRVVDLCAIFGQAGALDLQGRRRVEIVNILETEPYLIVEARPIQDEYRMTRQVTALMRTARSLFERCVELNDSIPDEAQLFSMNINDPSWLADMIITSL